MKNLLLAFIIPFVGYSQVSMNVTGSYTQDFNSLVNAGSNNPWTDNLTIVNWFSQKSTAGAVTYDASTGTSNTGKVYSYGSSGSTDRALGAVGSASFGNVAHGVLLQNTSGNIINDLSVSYTMEQWRDGGALTTPAAQSSRVFYQISNSSISNLTPASFGGWTEVTALMTTSPVFSATATALDGNLPGNQVVLSNISIPNLTLFEGQFIMIKWDDQNHPDNDHGLSIDDVTINWNVSCNTSFAYATTSCGDFTVPSGDETYSGSGIYYDTIPNNALCDSILIIDLTVNPSTTYYIDADLDGYGDNATAFVQCTDPGVGYTTIGGDCNDGDDTVYPGAIDICDGIDNDCDLSLDEDATFINYYVDGDLDGYGTGTALQFCSNPGPGFATNDQDCDDNDNNATIPMMYYPDGDTDGFGDDGANGTVYCNDPGAGWADNNLDCSDAVNTVYPGAPEICDGLDNNCVNGIDEGLTFTDYYVDADGDNHGTGPAVSFCSNPGAGYSLLNDDCDDANASVYPGAPEVLNNGTDENCDGTDNYLGLEETAGNTVNIFPNPSIGKISVSVNSSEINATLNVLDMNGRIVFVDEIVEQYTEFDLSFLQNGTYLIKIESAETGSFQRLIISK